MRPAERMREAALILSCAGLLAAQLLAPHFIGLADNGDFAKISGRLSLGPKGGPIPFVYFTPEYVRSARYFWASPVLSTEQPLAWLASRLANTTKEGDAFDLRWMGAVHAALFLGALYALLRCLRGLAAWRLLIIAGVAIFVFSDVNYVAYLNSLFTDAVALVALLLMTALAIGIALEGVNNRNALVFLAASLLFIGSKPQHAIWGALPAAFIATSGWRRGLAAALVVLAASAVTIAIFPADYRAEPLFDLVFFRLSPSAEEPATLYELGLSAEYEPFIGMHAFVPQAPLGDRKWLDGFTARTNLRAVLQWYLRHPARTLRFLNEVLTREAWQMRPGNLSNFRREDGQPPGARTNRFALWSGLRSALFIRWPYHILAWYAIWIAGSIRAVRSRQAPAVARLGWIALGIAVMGIGEFCVAALGDCMETYRHLFLFHACTDLTVCFAIAAVVFPQRRLRGKPD
jgi:hypothetical protein